MSACRSSTPLNVKAVSIEEGVDVFRTDSNCEAKSNTTSDEPLSDRIVFTGDAFNTSKITIKNTFVNIDDDFEVERDNRRRVKTAPACRYDMILDSDSESDCEVPVTQANSDQSTLLSKAEQFQTDEHESTNQPAKIELASKVEQPSKVAQIQPSKTEQPPHIVTVKNTFVNVNEGNALEGHEHRCVSTASTAPGGYDITFDSDSESECEDEANTDHSFLQSKTEQHHHQHPLASHALDEAKASLGNVQGSIWRLSRLHSGCWAVQKALESAASEEARCALAFELRGHVWEAAHDLHANYVLQKCIMVMHPKSMQFILDELTYEPGAACLASENKFGCRVIQRLLEYCSHAQVVAVVDDLLLNCAANCCHKYSKYAMQCLLEHGTVPQVHNFMNFLAANANQIARDPHGCSVMGKAMSTGLRADQVRVAEAVSAAPGLFRFMGQQKQSHYVANIIREVLRQARTVEVPTDRKTKTLALNRSIEVGTTATCIGVNSTVDNKRRRGKGGGKTAQEEAEARDLLESLRAACIRRSPARIAKALQRVQNAFSTPWASPALTQEAANACKQAHQIMWTLSTQGKASACFLDK